MKPRFAATKPGISRRITFCLIAFATLWALSLLFACGPAGPREGTPAFFWVAAKEAFVAGDYTRTTDNLDRILESDNEYTARAMPWSLLVTSGLASGYMDLADQYQAGAKANKEAPVGLYRQLSNYQSFANHLTLAFADSFAKFDKSKDDSVTLDFPFPSGSAAAVPELALVAEGNLLPAATADAAEKHALARGILLATIRAAGAPEDAAKAEQILKSSGGKVPRATFSLAMARTLFEESQLYSRQKLYDFEKMTILCQRALAVLGSLPETPETKDLGKSIRLAMKIGPKT
jgi:hypothetical protein